MFENYLLLLILFFFTPKSLSDECYNDLTVLYEQKDQSSKNETRYIVQKRTGPCFADLLTKRKSTSFEPALCPLSMASINVLPMKIIPDDRRRLPTMTVNITIDILEEIDSVYLQFECLQASDSEDGYCHDTGNLVRHDGDIVHPCRSLDLLDSKPIFPIRFAYNCFRIFGFSQYRINATFYPRNCRVSMLFTAPSIGELFPEILQVYQRKEITIDQSAEWSPLLVVDPTEIDGVWFRFATPDNYTWREMRISVAERTSESRILRIVQEFLVTNPSTGVKWHNAPLGDYTVFAYVPRHDCSLVCKEDQFGCRVCVHTPLNFTLFDHKASVPWKTLRAVGDAGFYVILILIGIVIIVGVGGFTILAYARCRAIKNPRNFELIERPVVLLVFADDCQEHSEVILQLSSSIGRLANAKMLVDEEQLLVSGEKPSRWLISSLASASKVLIAISPTVPYLIRTNTEMGTTSPSKSLKQRRPFPDLFSTAIDMIMSEISLEGNRDRFALLRLPYSPPTPPQLNLLGLQTFEVPSNLVGLTSFLHRVEAEKVSHPLEEEERRKVQEAIGKFSRMIAANPNWIDERLIDKKTQSTKIEIGDIPYQAADNNSRSKNSDEGLGLIEPPDSDDDDLDNYNRNSGVRAQLLEPSDSETE